MPYRHTEFGTLILVVCLIIAALGAAMMWHKAQAPMILMLAILGAVVVFFHSLTVEIGDNELRWHFGPGLWTYRLPQNEIESVAAVHNHWWNGFGIRTAPGFTLYNVSGLDAVELKLKSGGVKRIGTDDRQVLQRLCGHSLSGARNSLILRDRAPAMRVGFYNKNESLAGISQ